MDSLAEFRVSHRARLSALFGQSVAEGLGAYRTQLEQATYDPAVLASALFGELPDEGPVRDDLPSWSEDPAGTTAPTAPEELTTAQVTRTTPDDYMDTIPSETYDLPEDEMPTACAADTGGVFGGIAAVPSSSATFGGKPAAQNKAPPPPLPATDTGSQAASSGQLPPSGGNVTTRAPDDPVSKKATQKRPPVVPPSSSTAPSSTTSKPPGAPARDPHTARSPPPPKRPSNTWGTALPSDFTGDPKGSAVPVRGAEASLPAWAPVVAADGLPYHTSPPDYWDLSSVCRVRCPVCFSGMCSRRNLKGFRRAHSRHRCHACTQQGN